MLLKRRMGNQRYHRVLPGLLAAAASVTLYAGELGLRPETLKIWNEYEHAVGLAMQQRLHGDGRFLRVDQYPDRIARTRQRDCRLAGARSKPKTCPLRFDS